MEGINLHKQIRPFSSKEKNKETLTEQSAFVNNFLATIDGVRVQFVDNLDEKPFTFSNIQSFKDNQIYIENGETKERKVETKKLITLVRINKNINYIDFARLVLKLEEHLNQKQNKSNLDLENDKTLDKNKDKINITDYQGNLLGWQSQQLGELAKHVKSEKAKKAIQNQAQEYRTIANILLKKDEKNTEFRLDKVGVNEGLDTTKMETYTINQQRLHYAKQEYRAMQWKRDYLKTLIDDEVGGLNKLKEQKQQLKTEVQSLEDKKDKDSINLKTLNYTKIFYIERLIEAYNSRQNGNLQGVINEAMCASLKTRLESSFNDVVMKSGIESVANAVFEQVDKKFNYEEDSSSNSLKNITQKMYVNVLDRNKVKVKQIENLAKNIKQEKDINQKSKLEVEFIKKVNEVIFDQDLFKSDGAIDKIGTEAIQTFSQLTEEQKYEVICTTHTILQKMFFEKYLNRYLLGGDSTNHALGVFETSNKEVYVIDRKNPIKVSYNLDQRGVQNESDYHQGENREWLLVGDFETNFQAWEFVWLRIRYSSLKYPINGINNWNNPTNLNSVGSNYGELGNLDSAKKYFIQANQLTNWSSLNHLNNLGLAYFGLEEYNEAISTFKKTLEIDKENIQALDVLSHIYSLTGKKELMLQHLQKAINKDKDLKRIAKENTDFRKYWEDADFKKIVDS